MSGFVKCLEKYVDDHKEPSTRSIFTKLRKAHGYKSVAAVSRNVVIEKDAIHRMLSGSQWDQRKWYQLVIGMQLSLSEAELLMRSAGRTISLSDSMGLITKFALIEHKYDYEELNDSLETLRKYMRVPFSKNDWFDELPKSPL